MRKTELTSGVEKLGSDTATLTGGKNTPEPGLELDPRGEENEFYLSIMSEGESAQFESW